MSKNERVTIGRFIHGLNRNEEIKTILDSSHLINPDDWEEEGLEINETPERKEILHKVRFVYDIDSGTCRMPNDAQEVGLYAENEILCEFEHRIVEDLDGAREGLSIGFPEYKLIFSRRFEISNQTSSIVTGYYIATDGRMISIMPIQVEDGIIISLVPTKVNKTALGTGLLYQAKKTDWFFGIAKQFLENMYLENIAEDL
jgi:hypothetical protein